MDSFAKTDMDEPIKPKPIRSKPTKSAKTRLKPAQSVSRRGDPHRTEKACNKCHTVKPLSDYDKNAACRDGHVGTCMVCARARQAAAKARRKQMEKLTPAASPKPPATRECDICGAQFRALDTLLEHKKMRHSA
ncbi:MAG: hypothetical protein V1876_02370 [Candidatus Peregrinibacteria bacterium]